MATSSKVSGIGEVGDEDIDSMSPPLGSNAHDERQGNHMAQDDGDQRSRRRTMQTLAVGGAAAWAVPSILSTPAAAAGTIAPGTPLGFFQANTTVLQNLDDLAAVAFLDVQATNGVVAPSSDSNAFSLQNAGTYRIQYGVFAGGDVDFKLLLAGAPVGFDLHIRTVQSLGYHTVENLVTVAASTTVQVQAVAQSPEAVVFIERCSIVVQQID